MYLHGDLCYHDYAHVNYSYLFVVIAVVIVVIITVLSYARVQLRLRIGAIPPNPFRHDEAGHVDATSW